MKADKTLDVRAFMCPMPIIKTKSNKGEMKSKQRLENVGFTVKVTPFGWFFALETKLIDHSLGRIFKDI